MDGGRSAAPGNERGRIPTAFTTNGQDDRRRADDDRLRRGMRAEVPRRLNYERSGRGTMDGRRLAAPGNDRGRIPTACTTNGQDERRWADDDRLRRGMRAEVPRRLNYERSGRWTMDGRRLAAPGNDRGRIPTAFTTNGQDDRRWADDDRLRRRMSAEVFRPPSLRRVRTIGCAVE